MQTDEDCEYLYQLQLIPGIRYYSINNSIPSVEEHIQWFNRIITSTSKLYKIQDSNGTSMGMIRIDYPETKIGEISIIIDPAFAGQGIAKTAINKAVTQQKIRFRAKIHEDNIASIKAFEANGFNYSKVDHDKFHIYIKG